MNTAIDFNEAPEPVVALTTRVTIGWDHTVEEIDGESRVVYALDDAGNHIPRSYVIPARLTTRQLLDRTKNIPPATIEGLAKGDIEAILTVADCLVGGGVVEAVGTDPTVSTDAFVKFVTHVLTDLAGGQLGVGPGNF